MTGKIVNVQKILLLNLFQISKIKIYTSNKTYRSTGYREIKTHPIKVLSRSELKFTLTIPFLGHREIKTFRIKVMSRSEFKFFIDNFFGTPCLLKLMIEL